MSLKFTTTEQQTNSVKVLGYGESGVGKTRLCETAPSPLILSTENGLLSLAHTKIPVIELGSADDCFDALDFVLGSNEAKQFRTICLDSSSDIAEIMLSDYKKQYKDPRQAYGKLSENMGDLIRQFRGIPDKHVYCVAKIAEIKDEYTGLLKYRPSMPGKSLTSDIPYFFDEVVAVRLHTGETTTYRYLQTTLDTQYIAKDRSGMLDAMEEPHLGNLFDKILKGSSNDDTDIVEKTNS